MKERVQELKAVARRGPRAHKADGESDVLAKIAEMPEPDRAMAERFGFSDKANLDAGVMWPTSFALKELTSAEEARIGALVKKAVS
jgi:hypothetical protein